MVRSAASFLNPRPLLGADVVHVAPLELLGPLHRRASLAEVGVVALEVGIAPRSARPAIAALCAESVTAIVRAATPPSSTAPRTRIPARMSTLPTIVSVAGASLARWHAPRERRLTDQFQSPAATNAAQ